MSNYLETNYFRDEYDENAYPQQLCDHIIKSLIRPHFGRTEAITLLDVGSGKGNHLVGFSRRGLKVFGLDKRDECLNVLDQFDIRECDIEKDPFPFETNRIDVVYSKSVLEHIVSTDNFFSEVFRVLRTGGLAIIMVPDWGTQYKTFYDDYTHVKAWTRKGLQNAMRMHNFKNVDCRLFRQLPLLWKYPQLKILCDITSLLPESFKWKDKKETQHRKWIRFSREKMLLAIGIKNHE